MNPITIILTVLFTLLLTACGGGSPSDESTTDAGTGDGSSTAPDPTNPTDPSSGSNSVPIGDIGFGSGSGGGFKPGAPGVEGQYSLLGQDFEISANIVNTQKNNETITEKYQFVFSSACASLEPAAAHFSVSTIGSELGSASSIYHNSSCLINDEITVQLFAAEADVATATAIATISTAVQGTSPQLGYGAGADYVDGLISGETILLDTLSTKLTANAVDRGDLNSKVNTDRYEARWSTTCTASTFSIESQSLLSGEIVTRYDANSCTGTDTVTLSLYARDDLTTVIDSTSVTISIGESAGIEVEPSLGSGEGSDFSQGQINLSADYALAGGSVALTINGVNTKDNNNPLVGNYLYKFESSCPANSTRFSSNVVANNSGEITNTYFNRNCQITDTITVSVFAEGVNTDTGTALATANASIVTSLPKLGFGSGADYVDGLISGQTILVDSLSTKLSANAINAVNLNSKILSRDYEANWTSSCADSSFSIESQSLLLGDIVTRYDANSCTGSDTITLSLYARDDLSTVLDSTSVVISIGDSAGVEVEPKLGFGNGSGFSLNQINLSADYALAGGSVTIVVNGVNRKDNNALLSGNYLYKFESSCPANSVRFSSDVIANNNGTVNNTYYNRQCQITDTITISLFEEGANTDTDAALASASTTLETALPKLGYNSGAEFIEGVIEGNYNLVDEASTFLSATVVDPMNINTILKTSEYYIEWQSLCSTAKFSIESQSVVSDIKTRYVGDAGSCTSDTVTLTLFNQSDDELDSITADISINESLIPAEPGLGRGLDVSFVAGELDFSESDIAARQTIEVAVNIVDTKDGANTLITGTEYAVNFNSVCVKDGRSTFDKEQVRTTSGVAKVYYTASGCTVSDTINAVLYPVENNVVDTTSSIAVATDTINIELPQVNSIEYQDMSSRQIALQGISFTALPEVTEVNFIVKDEFNQPISGKEVTFSLSNKSVDATLSGDLDSDGEVVASTNANGVVTAYVNSGKSHGLVSVLATTSKNGGGVLRTQSFGISITTGIPVQPSFSLALDNYNPRGWDANGEVVTATVQLADRFHNPVPDGTVVNFLADGGIIEPQCETANGACSVSWRSANPRPGFSKDNSQNALQKSKTQAEHPTNDSESQFHFNKVSSTDLTKVCGPNDDDASCDPYRLVEVDPNWNGGRSGLVTILAYVEGEVDFADTNGNGRFDDGESFSAMSEAYLDANEDGQYTAPDDNNPFEQLIEYSQDGVMTAAPTTYQGGSCTDAARAAAPDGPGHCKSLVHLREQVQLVMSSDAVAFKVQSIEGGSNGNLGIGNCINVYNEEYVTFNFAVNDYNGNIPIKETGMTLVADGFNVDAQPNPIGNEPKTEGVYFPLTIRADDEAESGFIRLFANHPDAGEAGSITIENLTDDPSIKIITTDYLMDIAAGPQILEFTFADACGQPPGASDLIIFEVEEVDVASFNKEALILTDSITNVKTTAVIPDARAQRFQINANQLTGEGKYRIQISETVPVSAKTQGKLIVRTINFAAAGLETRREFLISF